MSSFNTDLRVGSGDKTKDGSLFCMMIAVNRLGVLERAGEPTLRVLRVLWRRGVSREPWERAGDGIFELGIVAFIKLYKRKCNCSVVTVNYQYSVCFLAACWIPKSLNIVNSVTPLKSVSGYTEHLGGYNIFLGIFCTTYLYLVDVNKFFFWQLR